MIQPEVLHRQLGFPHSPSVSPAALHIPGKDNGSPSSRGGSILPGHTQKEKEGEFTPVLCSPSGAPFCPAQIWQHHQGSQSGQVQSLFEWT